MCSSGGALSSMLWRAEGLPVIHGLCQSHMLLLQHLGPLPPRHSHLVLRFLHSMLENMARNADSVGELIPVSCS